MLLVVGVHDPIVFIQASPPSANGSKSIIPMSVPSLPCPSVLLSPSTRPKAPCRQPTPSAIVGYYCYTYFPFFNLVACTEYDYNWIWNITTIRMALFLLPQSGHERNCESVGMGKLLKAGNNKSRINDIPSSSISRYQSGGKWDVENWNTNPHKHRPRLV